MSGRSAVGVEGVGMMPTTPVMSSTVNFVSGTCTAFLSGSSAGSEVGGDRRKRVRAQRQFGLFVVQIQGF